MKKRREIKTTKDLEKLLSILFEKNVISMAEKFSQGLYERLCEFCKTVYPGTTKLQLSIIDLLVSSNSIAPGFLGVGAEFEEHERRHKDILKAYIDENVSGYIQDLLWHMLFNHRQMKATNRRAPGVVSKEIMEKLKQEFISVPEGKMLEKFFSEGWFSMSQFEDFLYGFIDKASAGKKFEMTSKLGELSFLSVGLNLSHPEAKISFTFPKNRHIDFVFQEDNFELGEIGPIRNLIITSYYQKTQEKKFTILEKDKGKKEKVGDASKEFHYAISGSDLEELDLQQILADVYQKTVMPKYVDIQKPVNFKEGIFIDHDED